MIDNSMSGRILDNYCTLEDFVSSIFSIRRSYRIGGIFQGVKFRESVKNKV